MPLYICDGCWEQIPVLKARIHCEICEDFDLCANCYIVERFGKIHTKDHKTVVKERSGLMPKDDNENENEDGTNPQTTAVVPKSLSAMTSSPPHAVLQSPVQPHTPLQNQTQLLTPSPAETQVSTTNFFEAPVTTTMPMDQFSGSTSQITGIGWEPLFQDTQPTQMMTDLLTAIFICLDTEGTRLLAPEQYSAFLDAQGYAVEENVWKRNVKPQFGYNPEDVADFELRTAYENFSIDHVLQGRVSTMDRQVPFHPSLSPISNGQMPMLSLRGFIDITAIETLGEPSVGWHRLNLAKRFYGVWMDWGDVPRHVVPEVAPQVLLERIAQISAFAQVQAAERVNARRLGLQVGAQNWSNQVMMNPTGVYRYQ